MVAQTHTPEELHPYVVLLPTSIDEKVRYITTLLSSPVTIEILRLFAWDREICQKEIITSLSQHSNKTVISSIRRLVSLNLLEEEERVEVRGNRKVRVKCYKLTDVGRWYNVLFKDIDELDSEVIREAATSLSVIFMAKILPFSEHLKIGFVEFINQVMSSAIRNVARSKRHRKYDLAVFGSLALDVYLKPEIRMSSGGSGANVAALASNLGLKTCFISRASANIIGIHLLAELISEGVDVSLTELDREADLPLCVVLEPLEPARIMCKLPADPRSLPVMQRVSDEVVQVCDNSRSIYLGEGVCRTYLELMGKISRNDKVIVFRPHAVTLEQHLEEFMSMLQYAPILVLNEEKERILRSRGLEVPGDLFKAGVENIVVTRGAKGATLYVRGREPSTYPAPPVNAINTVGAGDAFTASLIHHLLRGVEIGEAVRRAVHISALSTTQPLSRKRLAGAVEAASNRKN
jgi:sugar/nucleoside kinase (ribokinase family)